MTRNYDLVIRDAYVHEHEATVDIAVDGETIADVAPGLDADGRREIDADDNLVSPGFVECHLHIDKAFNACGGRTPKGHDEPFTFERIAKHEREYFEEASVEDIRRNAIKNVQMAVAAGSTYVRSHVGVDTDARGLQNMEAVVDARNELEGIADLQFVVSGGDLHDDAEEEVFREAIEMGMADDTRLDPVLVGGADPATRHNDIEGAVTSWYDIAEEYDVDMDLHIQDGGTLGVYTLERLVEYSREYDYDDRVTASHSYALSNIPEWWQDDVFEDFDDVDMKFVTCYQSTRPEMPVRKMLTEGLTLGHGTDNDRDFVFPHGNADGLEGLLIESNKLHGDRTFVEDYRWYDTDEGLANLWSMITDNGARVLGVQDQYGIEPGNPANLVVLDEPSPQWAIITQAERSYVIKDGNVVAEDGELLPEYTIVEDYADVLDEPIRGH